MLTHISEISWTLGGQACLAGLCPMYLVWDDLNWNHCLLLHMDIYLPLMGLFSWQRQESKSLDWNYLIYLAAEA